MYLVIKELNKNQDDAFIVISSLEKDINGSVELFRANALRVHSQVIDVCSLSIHSPAGCHCARIRPTDLPISYGLLML